MCSKPPKSKLGWTDLPSAKLSPANEWMMWKSNAIRSVEPTAQVDFVELLNPGNFKGQKGTLIAGGTCDVEGKSFHGLTRTSVHKQKRLAIAQEDPLILMSHECTTGHGVFTCAEYQPETSACPEWEQKYQEGCDLLSFASKCYWDQTC